MPIGDAKQYISEDGFIYTWVASGKYWLKFCQVERLPEDVIRKVEKELDEITTSLKKSIKA